MIIHLIELDGVSILDQLFLEEALLREDKRNFCLINKGSSPAIVMGISGKHEELVHTSKASELKIPVIQRFSGGGTVVVDQDTLFVTFICNKEEFSFPSYPERILKWSEEFYQKALPISDFSLRENDFVIADLKCGGNAQYIKKERWLQHTSFLWNFCPDKMQTLLMPKKTPSYRQGRSHLDFLCTLNTHLFEKKDFFNHIKNGLEREFTVKRVELDGLNTASLGRRQTKILDCY